MHPTAFSSCIHDTGAAHVRQMSADFGLISFKNFHKKADTHFVIPHQV
jgi:hypothetical protein